MGGEWGVSSTLGAGSTFWFTVKVRADAAQASHGRLAVDADLAGVAALVVDDSPTQRGLVTAYLTDWGMNVTTAGSGPAALAAMRAAATDDRPFALALVDRSMPGMDGIALKDAIVADPTLDTPVVLLVGLGQERELDASQRAGVFSTLSKPLRREDLHGCLRVCLGVDAAPTAPATTTRWRPAENGRSGHCRLLLAEDNPINQKVTVAMLTSGGYRVDVVPDGSAAVEAVTTHHYDLVLMDCQMPVMSGYEATVAIRAQEGTGRHIPIIAMTAGARSEDRERCLASGMDSYLGKPVSKDVLLALVEKYATVA